MLAMGVTESFGGIGRAGSEALAQVRDLRHGQGRDAHRLPLRHRGRLCRDGDEKTRFALCRRMSRHLRSSRCELLRPNLIALAGLAWGMPSAYQDETETLSVKAEVRFPRLAGWKRKFIEGSPSRGLHQGAPSSVPAALCRCLAKKSNGLLAAS